jgi:hypothetical protein
MMLNSASNVEQLFHKVWQKELELSSAVDQTACCVFCKKPRPLELVGTHMCAACKRKSIFQLFWQLEAA